MIMMINIAQRLQPAASEQEVHWEARAGANVCQKGHCPPGPLF